jgi:hypothetical protein
MQNGGPNPSRRPPQWPFLDRKRSKLLHMGDDGFGSPVLQVRASAIHRGSGSCWISSGRPTTDPGSPACPYLAVASEFRRTPLPPHTCMRTSCARPARAGRHMWLPAAAEHLGSRNLGARVRRWGSEARVPCFVFGGTCEIDRVWPGQTTLALRIIISKAG